MVLILACLSSSISLSLDGCSIIPWMTSAYVQSFEQASPSRVLSLLRWRITCFLACPVTLHRDRWEVLRTPAYYHAIPGISGHEWHPDGDNHSCPNQTFQLIWALQQKVQGARGRRKIYDFDTCYEAKAAAVAASAREVLDKDNKWSLDWNVE